VEIVPRIEATGGIMHADPAPRSLLRTTLAILSVAVLLGGVVGQDLAEADLSFDSDEATLVGTLTLPEGDGPHPAVILLTGSGPQDRDNAHPSVPGYRPFASIADHLADSGIAVFRYDERGVGASGGDHQAATSFDLADDAETALAFLRSHDAVDPDTVGLLGHSEGAWLAAIVAARDERVAFVVALAGHAVPGAELLPVQAELGLRASGAPEERIERILADQASEIQLIVNQDWEALEDRVYEQTLAALEASPAEQKEAMGDLEMAARQQVAKSMIALQGWLFTFLTEDPSDAWSGVDAPVLAVFGGLDTQVDLQQNRGPLEASLAGNEDVTVRVIDDANHLFQRAETPGDAYDTLDTALHPDLLPMLTAWLQDHVR
jgi:dienelactone hydrolase